MLFVQGTDLRWKQGMRGCRVPTLLEMQVSEAGDMAQKVECLLSMHKALDVILIAALAGHGGTHLQSQHSAGGSRRGRS